MIRLMLIFGPPVVVLVVLFTAASNDRLDFSLVQLFCVGIALGIYAAVAARAFPSKGYSPMTQMWKDSKLEANTGDKPGFEAISP